jgi:hypothetical protein
MANKVLPQPALPQTSVGRPRGSPPAVISSSPCIPVGALGKARCDAFECDADFVMDYVVESVRLRNDFRAEIAVHFAELNLLFKNVRLIPMIHRNIVYTVFFLHSWRNGSDSFFGGVVL